MSFLLKAARKTFSVLESRFLGHPIRLLTTTGVTVLWAHVIHGHFYSNCNLPAAYTR